MGGLPLAPISRVLRKAGAERVSAEACAELAEVLEDIAIDIGRLAIKLSRHAGRKTVTAADIRLASK